MIVGRSFDDGLAMAFGLQNRQTVVVRTKASSQQRIAVEHQVLRCDRCRNIVASSADKLDRLPRRDVLQNYAQVGVALQ